MKRLSIFLIAAVITLGLLVSPATAARKPRPTPTPTIQPTPTPTMIPTPTLEPTPTATPTVEPTPTPTPSRPDPSTLQVGDLLTKKTNSSWDHDAIYVGYRTWNYLGLPKAGYAVIDSTGDRGVDYTLLTDFYYNYNTTHLTIQRLGPVTNREALISQAVAYAENKMGTPYDWFFNKYNDSRLYCSEMIWHGFYYGQFMLDLDVNGGSTVTPADILNSPHLQLVYQD